MIPYSQSTDCQDKPTNWLSRIAACFSIAILSCTAGIATAHVKDPSKEVPHCEREIEAYVVAIEQAYTYNRFGSFNPNGMMYALRRDVVDAETGQPISLKPNKEADSQLAGKVRLRENKRPRPLVLRMNMGDCLKVIFTNLLSPSVSGQDIFKDPLSDNLSVMDGEEPATRHASIQVNGLNYAKAPEDYIAAGYSFGSNVGRQPKGANNKKNKCSSNAAEFGDNNCVFAAPGETRIYKWYGKQEGGYLFHSMAGPAGGEGDGGQLGLGLFGSVNVQPKGAKWYRSQVTEHELELATKGRSPAPYNLPMIDYDATFSKDNLHDYAHPSDPILKMLKCTKDVQNNEDHKNHKNHKNREICELIYSDLNAVIDITPENEGCDDYKNPKIPLEKKKFNKPLQENNACGKPYREFTVIFHDEITAVQAFVDLENEENPLRALRDGMAINYGAAGLGSMVLANQKRIGPAANCKECKLEEFFLTSWANGDPALVVKEENESKKKIALYPDDPSNVHHSYMGDPVRFRNMHAGPKETHVFHLHSHQWVQDKHDPNSTYLDSQTISPGAVFGYEIAYGGSGNRNFVVGDSIFHCHLYPHFAQGMWALWRSHDVFEDGSDNRRLPDGEIIAGTPNPAIVPLPRTAMPPMPTPEFKGYPFYIAGQEGHRPPQPPMDLDIDPSTGKVYGGLPRHRILGATKDDKDAVIKDFLAKNKEECAKPDSSDLYNKGKKDSACNAERINELKKDDVLMSLASKIATANIELFPSKKVKHSDGTEVNSDGTDFENAAMAFHRGDLWSGDPKRKARDAKSTYNFPSKGYPTCDSEGNCYTDTSNVLFHVNGRIEKPGAPFADPCPDDYFVNGTKSEDKELVETREYKAAYVQFDKTVNKAGWHDPQARIAVLEDDIKKTLDGSRATEPLFFRAKSGECVIFKATNLIPANLNLDDFQIFSPTDTIGQHIHLVKFDVTSSDGSGNGWNYEDGTLAADEVRERIVANNLYQISIGGNQILIPETHRIFTEGELKPDPRGTCPPPPADLKDAEGWKLWAKTAADNHPWCGAQTTIQRWWADPLLNMKPSHKAIDRTIRTVFTHDHFGPSSHQHHGFYAALVIEPTLSEWEYLNGDPMSAVKRKDGGPTHYAANVIVYEDKKKTIIDKDKTAREFNLAFADYAIVYTNDNKPVNPPNRKENPELPNPGFQSEKPAPEGISTKDPGTQLINYRNEPIPLRIGERRKVEDQEKETTPLFSCSPAGSTENCFVQRTDDKGDMANVFSSSVHADQQESVTKIYTEELDKDRVTGKGRVAGDPATPILRMYSGDNVQIRLIQGAQEENHVFTMHGGKWLSQPDSPNSGYMNAQSIGISEHFEANIKLMSPSVFTNVDYLYSSSASDNLWDGQWGILRAFAPMEKFEDTGLAPLLPEHRATDNDNVPNAKKYTLGFTEDKFNESLLKKVIESLNNVIQEKENEINLSDEKGRDYLRKSLETYQKKLAELKGLKLDDFSEFMKKTHLPYLLKWYEFDDRFSSRERAKNKQAIIEDTSEVAKKLGPKTGRTQVCDPDRDESKNKSFNITAWHARDILPGRQLVYNKAFGISDPNAILFVEDPKQDPDPKNRFNPDGTIKDLTINRKREILQKEYENNKRITEPLILRANAGDCIKVTLFNALGEMPDKDPMDSKHWSFNTMPPIIEGFNFNQIRSSNHVGLHPQLVAVHSYNQDGANIGLNKPSTAPPCTTAPHKDCPERKLYEWYAGDFSVDDDGSPRWTPIEFGVVALRDMADVIKHSSHGAIGALVIEPEGSTWAEDGNSKASMAITTADGKKFQEFVVIYQDDLSLQWYQDKDKHLGALPNLRNADDAEDTGQKAFNYRTEPIWARLGSSVPSAEPESMLDYDWSNVFNSNVAHFGCPTGKDCDPETPIFTVEAGTPVRFRVVHPGGHPRNHSFTVHGHDWSMNPWIADPACIKKHKGAKNTDEICGSTKQGWNNDSPSLYGTVNAIGPARHVNILTQAGGDFGIPGDYMYRTQEGFTFGGGLWGILRVTDKKDPKLGK